MPSTERSKRKSRAEARARRALIDPDTPRVPMGEIPWPTEAEMLARLESAHERRMGATAHKRQGLPPTVGRGNGQIRPGKDEY